MKVVDLGIGVYYVVRQNEHGIYMERVNKDGSPWIEPVVDNGDLVVGPSTAPARVQVSKKPSLLKRVWRKLGG